MKRNMKLKFILAMLVILTFPTACKKDWLDVNYDPLQLTNTSATPDLILPPLMTDAAFYSQEFEILNMWMGYWCGPSLPPALNLTNYTDIQSSGAPAKALPILEQKSTELGADFYTGIAKVLRVLIWQAAVDKLNSVPYTEALQSAILRPKYDDGKFIYEDLMKQLTIAGGLIKNANIEKNPKITIADIMFHGDKTKWMQFINSLKLRLLVHQANLPDRATYIAGEIQVIIKEGSGFLPSGTDAGVNPGYAITSNQSPYFGLYSSSNIRGGGRGDLNTGVFSVDFAHANEYALNLLKADNDPRIGFIYSSVDKLIPANAVEPFPQPAPALYRGSRFGLPINVFTYPYQNRTYISAVGGSRNVDVVSPTASGIIKGLNMDAWIMTSVETAFLQAEAVYRGWLPGDAEQAYKTAVKESFRWLNVGGNTTTPALSDAVFDQWYTAQAANPKINWVAAPDKYKLIMYQKYVALNGISPMETWTDYRRNGRFPDVPISVDPTRISNTIPIRFLYTTDEIVANADNVNALGPINAFTSKIWWMPN